MKTNTPDFDAVVSDAEREAAEAEALIEALEEKVKAGDESVSPEELETARGVSRFARLRIQGAHRKADRARLVSLQLRADAITAEIEDLDDTGDMSMPAKAAIDALSALLAAQGRHSAAVTELQARIHVLADDGGDLAALDLGADERSVRARGTRVDLVGSVELIRTVVTRGYAVVGGFASEVLEGEWSAQADHTASLIGLD